MRITRRREDYPHPKIPSWRQMNSTSHGKIRNETPTPTARETQPVGYAGPVTRRLITRGAQISASRRRRQCPQLCYLCPREYVTNRNININSSQDIPEEQWDIIILVNHHNKLVCRDQSSRRPPAKCSDQHSGTAVKHALSIINYPIIKEDLIRHPNSPFSDYARWQVPQEAPYGRGYIRPAWLIRPTLLDGHIQWTLIIHEPDLTRPQGDDRTPTGDHTRPTGAHKNALHWHQLNFFNHWLDIATRPGRR